MATSASPSKASEAVPWRKKHRMLLMNISFWMFWAAFPFAYFGGVRNQAAFIHCSFGLIIVACLVPLVTKK